MLDHEAVAGGVGSAVMNTFNGARSKEMLGYPMAWYEVVQFLKYTPTDL